MSFIQSPPDLGNQYDDDRVLRSILQRLLPADTLAEIEPELQQMGALAGADLYRFQLADRLNEPRLTQWSAWGERIDRIDPTPLWREAERIAARTGVVATAYEQLHGRYSRLHQFALAYLFTPSTDLYSCPLAMSDGAARTLQESGTPRQLDRAVCRLISRDPERFWTSGQWMTEATGGSDVSGTETVARQENGEWRLYGLKWFTSAAASQMALALARPEGAPSGSAGLTLFYLETRDDAGRLQGIRIRRLKDKLGTRKLPTAELELHGTPATPVGRIGAGIRTIIPLLNLTRTWNAVSACAYMRRGLALARSYAAVRSAFGKRLDELPLHLTTLADLQAQFEGAMHLTFRLVELIGRDEAGVATDEQRRLLRLLTPITKLLTARQAVSVTSECLEAHGGAGYIEDTGLPMLPRDSQVLTIWEGTTNVLSLDLLRALGDAPAREIGAELERCGQEVRTATLREAVAAAQRSFHTAEQWRLHAAARDVDGLQSGARRYAMTIGYALQTALTAAHAEWSLQTESDARAAAAAVRLSHVLPDWIIFSRDENLALARDLPYPPS